MTLDTFSMCLLFLIANKSTPVCFLGIYDSWASFRGGSRSWASWIQMPSSSWACTGTTSSGTEPADVGSVSRRAARLFVAVGL